MKLYLFFLAAFLFTRIPVVFAQAGDENTAKTAAYLESIRGNEAKLAAFFTAMPKGGDLHNHFTGSVYGEEYFDVARENNFYVDLRSFVIYPKKPEGADSTVVLIKTYKGPVDIRSKLISLWSVKDFVEGTEPSDDHFFATFGYFSPAVSGNEDGYLKTIKRRAILENTQYIEMMFLRPWYDRSKPGVKEYLGSYDSLLLSAQTVRNIFTAEKTFDMMYADLLNDLRFDTVAKNHFGHVVTLTKRAALPAAEDSMVLIRYQNYVGRTGNPSDVFAQLFLSFMSADDSLIVGVNIVAPEDNEISMRDYWLHTRMFAYMHKKFPKIKYSMHAGELALGLVKPEDLTWHISDAVLDAGAKRIGHGVDMAYEKNAEALLDTMRVRGVAVEINLASNEFILHVKGGRHPFELYHSHHVPIVISTDDAGVLRSNHIEQFVLLASRYKDIDYKTIKEFVYNSARYSFLVPSEKKKLIERLNVRFREFERNIAH
jgi:hypothetical protein